MIAHYLKVAVRNLLKYKTQSVISILGLALGLACFVLSAIWVRYEMTFDTFHRDADRIYLVAADDELYSSNSLGVPAALGEWLKENYSQIEEYAYMANNKLNIEREDGLKEMPVSSADSLTMRMFDIRIVEGSDNFYRLPQDKCDECAISEEAAIKWFGTPHAVGEKIKIKNRKEYTVGAVVSRWKGHSNFPYDLLIPSFLPRDPWQPGWCPLFVRLKAGTDVDALLEQMNRNFPKEMKETTWGPTGLTRFLLKPITELRLDKDFKRDEKVVESKYIVWFSVTGLLIIICSLVNYLTIYADRFRTRRREMALRTVYGASGGALLKQLATEQLLTIVSASMLGMAFIELMLSPFIRYSQIEETDMPIYQSCLTFIGIMALILFGITLLSMWVLRRSSLSKSIHAHRSGSHWLHRSSIVLQLLVCLTFITATILMQMQLYHLRNVDTGMDIRNRGSVSLWMNVDMNVWYEKVKQLPMVEEVISPKYYPMVGMGAMVFFNSDRWDGLDKPMEKAVLMEQILAGEEFFRFYDIQLIAGEWINAASENKDVNITESTARRMGWTPEEAIGKHIYGQHPGSSPYQVVGVVKDCAYRSPSTDVPYTMFINTEHPYNKYFWGRAFVLFKYKPGTWEECKKRIEEMQQAEALDKKLFLFSEEEKYNEYLRSEDALATLLGFASTVCILISVFGIYSLVTLTCEYRRKEIAIRKVNGATMKDILRIFAKEYALMLGAAALIAFPIAYVAMKQWIQTYNRQVEIGWLPFVVILMGSIVVIAASIGHRVWKAANENPANVVKSE